MQARGEAIRQHIIETANRLFYQRGYNQASFSDIADAADVPRGNFYYYFKTKDDILIAVIDYRLEKSREAMRAWETQYPEPYARLQCFFEMIREEGKNLSRYGCPMGSLNIELGKAQPELKAKAKQLFDLFRDWIAQQLKLLKIKNPDATALHILGRAQGLAVITQVYGDTDLLNKELKNLQAMIKDMIPAVAVKA